MPFVEELKEPWIVGLKAEDAGLSQDDIDNSIDTLFTVADANSNHPRSHLHHDFDS